MGFFDLFKSDLVYFPGCITYFKFNEDYELYKEIFSKLGIKFRELDKQRCSGLEAWEVGYDVVARKIARENIGIFEEMGIKRIITTSPGCYKMFLHNYSDYLPYWNIEVVNVWDLLLDGLRKKHWLIIDKANEVVTYHDSCYLGRYCKIYNGPRKIIEALGYEIKEMDNNKENSFCCGSCGGLIRVDSKIANDVARERILQAKRIGVKKIIVVGFENYSLLRSNVSNSEIEILELSHVLARGMGLMRREVGEEYVEGEEKVLIEAS